MLLSFHKGAFSPSRAVTGTRATSPCEVNGGGGIVISSNDKSGTASDDAEEDLEKPSPDVDRIKRGPHGFGRKTVRCRLRRSLKEE